MNKKKFSVLKRISMLSAVIMLTLTAAFSLTACGKSNIPENTVFSADDLAGKSVGVQLGTTGDIYVSDMESDGSGTKVERYNKGNDAIQHLSRAKLMLLLSMHSLLKHLSMPIATFACLMKIL